MPAEWKSPARPDEVIRLPDVVEEVVDLAEQGAGLGFEDCGTDQLKGLEGDWPLSALLA